MARTFLKIQQSGCCEMGFNTRISKFNTNWGNWLLNEVCQNQFHYLRFIVCVEILGSTSLVETRFEAVFDKFGNTCFNICQIWQLFCIYWKPSQSEVFPTHKIWERKGPVNMVLRKWENLTVYYLAALKTLWKMRSLKQNLDHCVATPSLPLQNLATQPECLFWTFRKASGLLRSYHIFIKISTPSPCCFLFLGIL